MKLLDATQWFAQDMVGFSDIHYFAARCRDTAASQGRESAALILLAHAASAFAERQEGVAVSTDTVHAFLVDLHEQAKRLNDAAGRSDDALLEALNSFAAQQAWK
ncbi:hypothetical protein [Paraburkholderia humisilvae]|uniref:HPt domain-containing protein n=1 Tax=Paraburkholderia humisilvae TaxID=627669 RepID=A0A6J5F080_9BURK|nr:hypothetical protein [Paraburkholderia humisilvae]CAB3770705.1 hypothetical protein LMG29542_06428 [Paraburkholderia humisilvae]